MRELFAAILALAALVAIATAAEWGKSGTTLPRSVITFGNVSSGTCTKGATLIKGNGIYWCYSTNASRKITIKPN